ncbi:MAG: REP element-mobilizing transposase RayT [Gammaproteobacteria bacterium]|jgi:REP element-mobilizing transposase RayT
MAYPRHLLVPVDEAGTYHCVSRCVRRAFLCGEDTVTGRSFEHRRQWVESRIIELANIFAVAIHAYAVMSNHFHLVLEINPTATEQWSDEEVAARWLTLTISTDDQAPPLQTRINALAEQSERLTVLRQRLGSLSWFMRYLKEPIARRANREDKCSGRFWEGRFKTQTLLDDSGVLASMVYVDLNPVRAGITAMPETSVHTSVRVRANQIGANNVGPMQPIATSIRSQLAITTATQYLELVDWTGRTLYPDKRGAINTAAPPIIKRLGLRTRQWCIAVPATESHYWRAIGQADALMAYAQKLGQKWLRGIGMARQLSRVPESS